MHGSGTILHDPTISAADALAEPAQGLRRYLVERCFASGAINAIIEPSARRVIANNRKVGVHWILSFVDAGRTRSYCIYEAAHAGAVREAARLNQLPIAAITEIPGTLIPPDLR